MKVINTASGLRACNIEAREWARRSVFTSFLSLVFPVNFLF